MANGDEIKKTGSGETLIDDTAKKETETAEDAEGKEPEKNPTAEIAENTEEKIIIESFTAPEIDELLESPIYAEMKEKIDTAQKEQVFIIADEFAKRYMLEKIIPTLPEECHEKAKAVIATVNFGTIAQEERHQYIWLAQIHQLISRYMISHMVFDENKERGFNPIEIEEIIYGIEMANATDDIYREWEFMQHDIPDPKERKKQGFTSKWHIVKKQEDETFKEIPYKEIFSLEYEEIETALKKLVGELSLMEEWKDLRQGIDSTLIPLVRTKLDYYTKLLAAYKETDPEKLPELWLKVDKGFVHQGGNLRAVHPIEDGYAANATGTIPEQSLRYFISSEANNLVTQKKEFILKNFPALLEGNEEALKQLNYVKNVDAGIALYVVRSGMELVFKIAGHNIPNEESARQEGIHVYIDPNTMNERLNEAKELFKGFFAESYHGLLDKISTDAALAEIATHEFGHNIGDYKFGKGIENAPGIEEWKATAATYVSQTLDPEAWNDEQLQGNFLSFLCQAMRYSQRRNEASQKPYYNADRFFMKVAQDIEIITSEEKDEKREWSLNLSREKLLEYAKAIKDKWLELQEIYMAKDRNRLEGFIKEAVTVSPFMDDADKFTKPE